LKLWYSSPELLWISEISVAFHFKLIITLRKAIILNTKQSITCRRWTNIDNPLSDTYLWLLSVRTHFSYKQLLCKKYIAHYLLQCTILSNSLQMIEDTHPICQALKRNRLEITAETKLLAVVWENIPFTSEPITFSQVITDTDISTLLLQGICFGEWI